MTAICVAFIQLAMPSVLRGLKKHREAGGKQGEISPIDIKAAKPSNTE